MCRLIAVVAWMALVLSASAQYRSYCDLSQEPVIQIGRDPVTGKFKVIQKSPDETPEGRNLQSFTESLRGSSFDNSAFHDAIQTVSSRLLDDTQYEGDLIEVRKCACSDRSAYCPIDKQHCGIPRRDRDVRLPGCVNRNKQQIFVRSIWIYLVVWIAILISIILWTPWGRRALMSLPGNCLCCGYREFLADRMLQRNPDQADFLIRRNIQRRRRILQRRYQRLTGETLPVATPVLDTNNGEMPTTEVLMEQPVKPPTSLALRTKRYNKTEATHDSGDDEFDDEATCTICFAPLEDGDRVGALSCSHIFHADCLKEWLRRRNICPLCQETEVATPRYEESEVASNEEESNASQFELTAQPVEIERMMIESNEEDASASQIELTTQQGGVEPVTLPPE